MIAIQDLVSQLLLIELLLLHALPELQLVQANGVARAEIVPACHVLPQLQVERVLKLALLELMAHGRRTRGEALCVTRN